MTTEADATVTTSKTFGKYRVLSVIGQGGMGVVYKAFDTTIERIVAVKTLHGGSLSGDMAGELRERFKRDAQAGGRLTHPNIAAVYEFGEAQGNAFIAMEFVEGRTLKQALEQGERFALAESVRIVREVLAALAHAHQRGVIHRDIKPANIVLTPAGAVKIIDFGIAHLDSSTMTVTGAMLGTPMYMAPEQVQGLPVTAAADIFAAGVVLYELLTNDQPFAAANTATTMRKVLDVVPVRPSRLSVAVPEWLDAVLEKAMAKNPADRFPTAEAFAEGRYEGRSRRRCPRAATSAGTGAGAAETGQAGCGRGGAAAVCRSCGDGLPVLAGGLSRRPRAGGCDAGRNGIPPGGG